MGYKLCKFCENRARDTPLRGVYIPHFGQIWVKISVFGVLHPCLCTDGGEIWHGEGDLHAKFNPYRCNVSPVWVEKPQNRPLSKLNTAACAASNAAGKNWTFLATPVPSSVPDFAPIGATCRPCGAKNLKISTNFTSHRHWKIKFNYSNEYLRIRFLCNVT